MGWIRGGGTVYISLPGSYFLLGKRWWDGPRSHSGCSNEDKYFKIRHPLWCNVLQVCVSNQLHAAPSFIGLSTVACFGCNCDLSSRLLEMLIQEKSFVIVFG
jgi:hypothetical protein